MGHPVRELPTETQLLFLPGIFNEALSLMFDAHQYFETRSEEEQASIEPDSRQAYAREMGCVTLRLSSVMSWLMVRRAVYAGHIEEDEAADYHRLDAPDNYREVTPEQLESMPYYLNYLSDRSINLYERIQRLDAEAYGEIRH